MIRDYAALRRDVLPELERAVAAGDRARVAQIEGDIQRRHGAWFYSLAGRQEWTLLDRLFKLHAKRIGKP